MKTILKKVHYCDFCKKHGLTIRIAKHEKYCTMNPDRECRMCKQNELSNDIKKIMKEFIPRGVSEGPIDGKKILNETDGCPACALAVIRIGRLNIWPNQVMDFDYSEEVKKFWEEINAEHIEY